jgi:hypothetical protein
MKKEQKEKITNALKGLREMKNTLTGQAREFADAVVGALETLEASEEEHDVDEVLAEIDRLRKELEDAKANAKSDTDKRILNMVAVAGGEEWLKGIKSQGKVDKRDTQRTTMTKMQAKASEERISLVEYRKRKAEKKAQNKK